MKTVVMPAEDSHAIKSAARLINKGQVVAFPTETVYGLGANAFDADACMKIFAAKNRPADNPLIVHISNRDMLSSIASEIKPVAYKLMDAFWPGPLTLIMKKAENIPEVVTAGLNTVAVRMPDHKDALALIEASGVPIAAPSANSSGRPSPTSAMHVFEDMDTKIPLILDGGSSYAGVESTILDISGDIPALLRPGIIPPELLSKVTECEILIDKGIITPIQDGSAPRAPGMKYTHYSPKANVVVCESPNKFETIINAASHAEGSTAVICLEERRELYEESGLFAYIRSAEDARGLCAILFDALRSADLLGVENIFCEGISADGIGLAYMNRLLKAAGYQTI